MARPSAADRIADLMAEVEQQRTRAEAAEAELRDVRSEIEFVRRDSSARIDFLTAKWTASEAALREKAKQSDDAEWAINDLTKALDRERSLNAAQCREVDRE